jgi:hypothetical protein
MPPKYSYIQDLTFSALFFLLVGLVIASLVMWVPLMYKTVSGFQGGPADGTDPLLVQIFTNLMQAYTTASEQVRTLGVESTEIEGTTLDKFLQTQIIGLQTLAQTCSAVICTDEQLKNPSLLIGYKTANTVGSLGLPDITFDTLAAGPPTVIAMPDATQQQPDTQLPPVQMPASVMGQPSLDECKKYYSCSISTNMN